MKCLRKWKWVKLPREIVINDKGIMNHFMKLASRCAFRKGIATYCGFLNPVEPGMWSGGIVGVKSILGVKGCGKAYDALDDLEALEYLTYTVDWRTKKLSYRITDWVKEYCGDPCTSGAVYASTGYGFVCIPRDITQRLVDKGYNFGPADAFLDLWCHTVYRDYGNAFSFLAPTIQFDKYSSVLTLETLGKRWGWEKTKVCRFFKKYGEYFQLYRLPASYGCVIYNQQYPTEERVTMPSQEQVVSICKEILIWARNTYIEGNRNEKLNCYVAWKSRRMLKAWEESVQMSCEEYEQMEIESGNGESKSSVALFAPIIRAYISHGRNCKHGRNCQYACQGNYLGEPPNSENPQIGAVRLFEPPNPFSLLNQFFETIGG